MNFWVAGMPSQHSVRWLGHETWQVFIGPSLANGCLTLDIVWLVDTWFFFIGQWFCSDGPTRKCHVDQPLVAMWHPRGGRNFVRGWTTSPWLEPVTFGWTTSPRLEPMTSWLTRKHFTNSTMLLLVKYGSQTFI